MEGKEGCGVQGRRHSSGPDRQGSLLLRVSGTFSLSLHAVGCIAGEDLFRGGGTQYHSTSVLRTSSGSIPRTFITVVLTPGTLATTRRPRPSFMLFGESMKSGSHAWEDRQDRYLSLQAGGGGKVLGFRLLICTTTGFCSTRNGTVLRYPEQLATGCMPPSPHFHIAILSLDNGHVKHEPISTYRQRIILFSSASQRLTLDRPVCTASMYGAYSWRIFICCHAHCPQPNGRRPDGIRAILLVRSPLGALTNQGLPYQDLSSGSGKKGETD